MKTQLSSFPVLVRLAGTAPSLPSAHTIAGRDPGSKARLIVRAMAFALLCLARLDSQRAGFLNREKVFVKFGHRKPFFTTKGTKVTKGDKRTFAILVGFAVQ